MGLKRRSYPTVNCHYCDTDLELRPNEEGNDEYKAPNKALIAMGHSKDFGCSACGCRNLRDLNGDFIWEPRMSMLEPSQEVWESQATASSSSAPNPFCRTCLANQSLQIHLLASFPDAQVVNPDQIKEREISKLIPDFKRNLDTRYPILCRNCAPVVEEIIQSRDYKIKSQTLGRRLQQSQESRTTKSVESESRVTRRRERWKWWILGIVWQTRGVAWYLTHVAGILICLSNVSNTRILDVRLAIPSCEFTPKTILQLALGSIMWSFWDPTWARARDARARGRSVEVKGRSTYLMLQGFSYLLRLFMSGLLAFRLVKDEIIFTNVSIIVLCFLCFDFAASFFTIHISPHAPVRLRSSKPTVDLDVLRNSHQDESDLENPLHFLSLSSSINIWAKQGGSSNLVNGLERRSTAPQTSSSIATHLSNNPKTSTSTATTTSSAATNGSKATEATFGIPSFSPSDVYIQAASSSSAKLSQSDELMDWDPIPPQTHERGVTHGTYSIQLAPQRLFPPDFVPPTGLESIFERNLHVADVSLDKDTPMKDISGSESKSYWNSFSSWWR